MSIASEITRLQGVKSDILQAIADKGVTVPAGSALDDCPNLIASISSGGGGVPSGYLPIEKISIPFNKTLGGVLLDVDTYNSAIIEVNCFIDYSITNWGELFILMLYNGDSEKGGIRCNPKTKELYGSNQNVSFSGLGTITESVYRLKLDKDKLTLNNNLYSLYYSKQSITSVSLGCAAGRKSYPYDVYGVKITDENDNVILNGIPVKRLDDNVEGIYDIVSSRFFVNNV